MRKMSSPPPAAHCDNCKGPLQWKRYETANSLVARTGSVYACGTCGTERVFMTQRDDYSPRRAPGEGVLRA